MLHWPRATALALALAAGVSSAAFAAGKDVTLGVPANLSTMDPYDANDTLSLAAQRSMIPGLFTFDKDMKVIPMLAESYEVSEDAKTFTIHLRKGVKFHDGTDFNAAAVKANFDRVTNPDNHLKRYVLFSNIAATEVVDDQTVRLQLKEPFASMINVLAHPSAGIISPAALQKWGKDVAFHPVGAGPFKFVSWNPTDELKVAKNEAYFKPGLPKVDSITFKPVPENGARVAMLQTGQAQYIYPMAPEQVKALQGNPDIDVIDAPSIIELYVALNTAKKPFDDLRVRQAMNYAVNRKAYAKIVWSGFADVPDSILPPAIPFHKSEGEWPYDPAKAKQLLAEAGYPNGFEAEIWCGTLTTSVRSAEFLQQQLGQVGIKLKITPLETGLRVHMVDESTRETTKLQMFYSGWSASTGEADWAIRPLLATESQPPHSWNLSFYNSPEVDNLIHQGLAVPDTAKRADIYGKIQDIVWKDAPWIYLGVQHQPQGRRKTLTGVYQLPDASLMVEDAELK